MSVKPDPNFLEFGHFFTGEDDAYRFRSIKPAQYKDSAAWVRPPHIHFTVFLPSGGEWTMQMCFAGEPLNKNDFLRTAIVSNDARKRLALEFRLATSAPDKTAHIGHFDIMLRMPGVTRGEA
tara:strand:- start:169 stop:534 length:366 start_codon:yes stop_codon:yes gene_type:complete